jgi:hypothetical protein
MADSFPMMDGVSYDELVRDIQEHGLLDPVIMFEGMILDGRNRKKACQELGLPAREVQYEGDDPQAFVWGKNAVRRQLDGPGLKLAAARLSDAGVGRPSVINVSTQSPGVTGTGAAPKGAPIGEKRPRTRKEVAELTGVPARQIDKAKKILKSGTPKVIKAVESGDLALDAAERLSRKPKEEQDKIMELPPELVAKAVPDPRWSSPIEVPEAPPGTPADEVAKMVRDHPRPPAAKYKLVRQMGLRELHMIRGVLKDWERNSGAITDLDHDQLLEFVKELRSSKTFYTRLINLIEEAVSVDAENKENQGS